MSNHEFDLIVMRIRSRGIAPRCIRKLKSLCTPREWAAHREYMAARYRDPRCKAMHKKNQLKHLARQR